MKQNPKVSVVIPSWNSELQLQNNLPSVLKAAAKIDAEVIVVEDDSQEDNSLEFLQSLKDRIILIVNRHNLGFGDSVNLGVLHARGDIVILLNTDVKPELDCFAKAITYFTDPKIFAVSFNSGEETGGGYWSRGLFHHRKEQVKDDSPNYSLWAIGGQAAFDKTKWHKLGGMDKLYRPFYWEDTDLGYSAWKRGWQIIWGGDCHVVHDHKQSVIARAFPKSYISDVAQRNQFLFVWKNITDSRLIKDHFKNLPRLIMLYPFAFIQALFLLPEAISRRSYLKRFWVAGDQELLSLWHPSKP